MVHSEGDIAMWKKLLLLAVLGMIAAILPGSPASAQATRTWVSGVGDDANPCSRTAPCKTFAGAISKTAAGGEIDALDPGGFGALTITKSITLDGGGGQVASVLVAGTNGINVAAGTSGIVILRNLRINGIANSTTPGLTGIALTSAAQLSIENCAIFNFNTAGIGAAVSGGATSKIYITDTYVTNTNSTAIIIAGAGGTLSATLNNVRVLGGKTTDLTVNGGATAMVNNSVLSGGGLGLDVEGGATVDVNGSVIDHNTTGVFNSSSTVRMSNSDVTFNGTGVSGTVSSFSNNRFQSNGAGGTISPIGSSSNPTGQQ
jgi:hypothetical protein